MRNVRNTIGGIGNLMFKQAYLYAEMRNERIPDIYVQSERYWQKYAKEIKAMYSEGITSLGMVSLHIRRGDYLNKHHFYVDLTKTDYYQKAVEMFPNYDFLVFCHDRQDPEQDKEDKKWTRKFLDSFIPDRYVINKPRGEADDLNRMASCVHNIMANSTFSWWAAYLNPNKDRRVVCPDRWFTDGFQRCELINEWTKIKV